MHMLLRFFLLFLRRNSRPRAAFNETTEISMRVLPIDLDFLLHVNNGVYFSFLDFGRMDMIFRNGVYELTIKKGWYGVVAGETIRFKKSLQLWDKFTIRTNVIGHDERYIFISQKFIFKNEVMACALIKIRFLKKKGGTVPIEEMLSHFKEKPVPEIKELSEEWYAMESKYLT